MPGPMAAMPCAQPTSSSRHASGAILLAAFATASPWMVRAMSETGCTSPVDSAALTLVLATVEGLSMVRMGSRMPPAYLASAGPAKGRCGWGRRLAGIVSSPTKQHAPAGQDDPAAPHTSSSAQHIFDLHTTPVIPQGAPGSGVTGSGAFQLAEHATSAVAARISAHNTRHTASAMRRMVIAAAPAERTGSG